MQTALQLAETGYLPDSVIRLGIRKLLGQRLDEMPRIDGEARQQYMQQFLKELKESEIAVHTEDANKQHYEVPAEFFKLVLGKNLKYSSCYYEPGENSLDAAEDAMLQLTCQRAQIKDGMKILDLGCGWGSLSLWIAKNFPNCEIHSVSNSATQKQFIDDKAWELGLGNVQVTTADINAFEGRENHYDRVVSIEMFEHMRNYKKLLKKVSSCLKEDGKLFVHIFSHRSTPYYFETQGDDNWMGQFFFTGGIMPSNDLLLHFQDDFSIEQQWVVNGKHYQRTALHWLENIDKHEKAVLDIFNATYGEKQAKVWLGRWRIFFLSCAELFGYRHGNEWWVSHYLFDNRK